MSWPRHPTWRRGDAASDRRRQISVIYVPEAGVGDWVLVHAGFAIGQVDEDEAAKTLELLREYSDNMVEL